MDNQSLNTISSDDLDINAIISAPLIALADAHGAMAKKQTAFMLDNYFTKNGDVYEPIMITMNLTRGVITPGVDAGKSTIQSMVTAFNLPLLTIIPLNSIAVESATINMDIMMTGMAKPVDGNDVKLYGKVDYPVDIAIANTDGKDHPNNNKISISINAAQIPLPKGVNVLIEAFAGAIQTITM